MIQRQNVIMVKSSPFDVNVFYCRVATISLVIGKLASGGQGQVCQEYICISFQYISYPQTNGPTNGPMDGWTNRQNRTS